ncbi:hypothetical protein EI94DRAFT_1439768, partial [Lactarius quietus]
RWAKLRIPNGQTARSVWYESGIKMRVRRASCIEFKQDDNTHIGNVQFFFYIRFGEDRHPLAMIRVFSLPDPQVFADSSETVYLSEPLSGDCSLAVIPVTAIHSVVAMFP